MTNVMKPITTYLKRSDMVLINFLASKSPLSTTLRKRDESVTSEDICHAWGSSLVLMQMLVMWVNGSSSVAIVHYREQFVS